MSARFFCSDASVARDEPLHGTASTVRRWIGVEQSGPWGPKALQESRLGEDASARLRAVGRAVGARVLLIRRHGRYEQRGHEVRVAFTGRDRRWLEALRFETTEELLAHDFASLRRGRSVGGERLDHLELFVCTHGKHDPCCARKGRAIAEALQPELGDRVWETSHIGGDRFAGNLLALPLGVYYGRVEPAQAVRLARRLDEGLLDLAHYRGRSSYPFAAQAAEWLVREKLTLHAFDALQLTEHAENTDHDDALSVSTFRLRDGSHVRATVEETAAAPAQLTCHADAEHRAPRYALRELTEV
ncbi:MAG: sucrase ferredoxin [Deltaproteobacteria bacterium]|nr:sucrase ferredoxin [Deltaproteobacteria bacterium]